MHRRTALGLFLASPFVITAPARADTPAMRIRDLYNKDRSFSELALSREGNRLTMQGFMAPPLKANMKFFVLTKMPMSVCPFCETEAEWPSDILAIYTKRVVKVIHYNIKIHVRGELELTTFKDPDTGFVSKARLMDASFEKA